MRSRSKGLNVRTFQRDDRTALFRCVICSGQLCVIHINRKERVERNVRPEAVIATIVRSSAAPLNDLRSKTELRLTTGLANAALVMVPQRRNLGRSSYPASGAGIRHHASSGAGSGCRYRSLPHQHHKWLALW